MSKNCEIKEKQERVFCFCRLCGNEIYVGESYYDLSGARVCTECLPVYAQGYFREDLRTAMIPGRPASR